MLGFTSKHLRSLVFIPWDANDAVYKFKRYEDASLSYTGINKHRDQEVGLYDTVLSPKDYRSSLTNVPNI